MKSFLFGLLADVALMFAVSMWRKYREYRRWKAFYEMTMKYNYAPELPNASDPKLLVNMRHGD